MALSKIQQRLDAPGPKRILALDGGGIRGLLTLGFLQHVETILGDRHANENFKLSDYFDLIGGTSTGAVIAAALATGWKVKDIKEMYLGLGEKVFKSALPAWLPGRLKYLALAYPAPRLSISLSHREIGVGGSTRYAARFETQPFEEELKEALGVDLALGDDERILTGLCIVTQRVDTGSTWPFHNNPKGRYFERNKHIPLWQIVRASTAAPVYFAPERIDFGGGQVGVFIDGGVSMANNPALQMFLLTTLKGYGFGWQTGADDLLLLSIGTGVWPREDDADKAMNTRAWKWATDVPSLLMDEATRQNQLLLQTLAKPLTAWQIDREVGTAADEQIATNPLLTYVRYNVELTEECMANLQLTKLANKTRVRALREMSASENREDLLRIGERVAGKQVRNEHFPATFDRLWA